MKKRNESFFGLHFDFHAMPEYGTVGVGLKEDDIREICREIKPDFIQIDCKGHPGWTSYPSALGNAMPSFALDPLEMWRRVTREEDIALYMHYSGVYELKYCAEHPEECTVDGLGNKSSAAVRMDGKYVDELLIPQLCELAEKYGVDGVWVDGDCWKATPDYAPESVAEFEKETGIDLGGKPPFSRRDKYFEEYREFFREKFRRYLRHYVDAIHEKHPGFQIASNWAFSDHMPEKISANVDFISGDLDTFNSFCSARYAGRAIAQHDFTWDLMSWNFRRTYLGSSARVPKHINQILQEAAEVISMGGGFQNYVMQRQDGSPNMDEVRQLKKLSEFVRERQDWCFRVKPVPQAVMLLSTYDRARESSNLYTRNGYQKHLGLTSLMCDAGQSLEIAFEYMLESECDKYPLVIVPELYEGLADKTFERLLRYTYDGGNLLLIGKNTCKLFAGHGAPFTTAFREEFVGIDENMTDDGHMTDRKMTKAAYRFTLDGESFGGLVSPCAIEGDGETVAAFNTDFNTFDKHDVLSAVFECGKGRIAVIGTDIGTQYLEGKQYLHRELIKTLADKLYSPVVKIESAMGLIEVLLTQKNGKLMIQLINANGSHANSAVSTDDIIYPIVDAKISVALDCEPKKITLQPEGVSLDGEYSNGRVYVNVPRVDIHSVIEIEV